MIRCPSCGNENKDGEAFCAFCAAILQAAPPADAIPGAPPPRAPASGIVTAPQPPQVPVPPQDDVPVPAPSSVPPAETSTGESGGTGEEELDPLDQFLVKEAERKHGPSDFMVEELGHFSSNFDNLEEQLEDAHRAAILKQKMAAIHAHEDNASAAGGDRLDQLDAILDMELEKAKQAALQEGDKASPSHSTSGRKATDRSDTERGGLSEEEKLARLERYKKFLEDPSSTSSPADGGSSELIRYLEAKVSRQAIEIEKLKEQKQELVKEVFSDALNDKYDDTLEKLQKAEKEIDKLETRVKELLEKRVVLEDKLLAKAEQVQKLLAERETIRESIAAEFNEQSTALQVRLRQSESRCAAQETELNRLKEQIARQTRMMTDLRASLAQAEQAARNAVSSDELERYRRRVASLQERLKKTMAAGATQLKALANYYEVVLNHISEVIIVFDANENIMFVNRAARVLLGLDLSAQIAGRLQDFPALSPIVPVAERAMSTDRTLHGGELLLNVGRSDTPYRLSFCPIVFPGREAFLLVMERVQEEKSDKKQLPPGSGLADYQIAALKEQVFSLKILTEIIAAKADDPNVVTESTGDLAKEIDHLLELLANPDSLV